MEHLQKNKNCNITHRDSTNNMKRKDRIVMTRLRTGHCKLTHGYLFKKTEPPMCIQCVTEFYQPIILYLNAASTTLKGKNTK